MRNASIAMLLAITFASCSSDQPSDDTQQPQKNNGVIPYSLPKSEMKGVVKEGVYEEKYPNGIIKMKGEYGGGKRFGQWTAWFENGKIWSEGFYRNGLKDGKWNVWYENGQKRYQGQYKEDKETGKWQFWDEKGKLVKEVDYDSQ